MQRIAAILALIAFALCLLQGLAAQNTFSTTVQRALLGMGGTYVIGLVVAAMGRKMLEESKPVEMEKSEDSANKPQPSDR